MLTPAQTEELPIELEKQFRDLEQRVMSDVVRRLKLNGNDITRSADWQINRLIELGKSQEEIKQYLANALKMSDNEIEKAYQKVIDEGYAQNEEIYKQADKDFIPYEDNQELQQLVSATKEQTQGEFKNITQSLGFATKDKAGNIKFQPIADYYQKTLDSAMLDIATGMFSYNTVLNRVVTEMTNSGLRTVDYASGWSNRVDVAARRAIMTGITQVTAKVNEDTAKDLGTNTFEVSYHSGARPSHAEWQGGIYTYEELETVCGLGSGEGLCGWNCYHSYSPFIPGISEPTYTKQELARMKAEDAKPVDYYGKKYTKYEALQRQRTLETRMRAQREKIKLLEEGGADEDSIITARVKYRVTSSQYAQFSKAMNLPQQRDRIYQDGKGGIGKGKWKLKNEYEKRSKDDYKNIEKTKVDFKKIETEKWNNNFKELTDDNNVNNSIRGVSKQLLTNRNGTFYESMYFVNAKSGKIEGFNTKSNVKLGVELNSSLRSALNNDKLDLIGIHNHPFSSVPSLSDLNAIAKRKNQSMGVVICHNGTIFTYTKPKTTIRKQDYDTALTKYKNYSKITNEDKAFEFLGNLYDFEYKRLEI